MSDRLTQRGLSFISCRWPNLFSSVKSQCCLWQLDIVVSGAGLCRGKMDLGNSASLLFCPPSNSNHRLLWGSTYTSTLRLATEYTPFLGQKSNSVALVLRFADNVLHNLTPSVNKCDLWEVQGEELCGFVSPPGLPS